MSEYSDYVMASFAIVFLTMAFYAWRALAQFSKSKNLSEQ